MLKKTIAKSKERTINIKYCVFCSDRTEHYGRNCHPCSKRRNKEINNDVVEMIEKLDTKIDEVIHKVNQILKRV